MKKKDAKRELPLFFTPVRAGFPSPATDLIDKKLDLHQYLITHPAATFFVRVEGDSMIQVGIHAGDLLIVDRALEPKHKDVVLAIVDGEFTVKRLIKLQGKILLQPENDAYEPIVITEEMEFEVWGVVAHVIHSL